ncbi:MAG: SRPBCC family protein [Actinomycetota bacterium]|nr:SRPBCC family protein [Actinomycetota bacterium]
MGKNGNNALTVTTPSDREIVMTRVFDAPRDLVFEAHSSCEHLSRWWGPRKYEVVGCDVDFRPGGAWRIVHRGPEGEEYAFRGEYREIVRPERIVWTFEFEGMPGKVSVETMTLEEQDGKTTFTSTTVFDSIEDRDGMLESGMESGAAETMDRLDEYLEVLKGGSG